MRRFTFFLAVILSLAVAGCASAELKLHIIDVGQGDAILVQCEGASLLVDAGPEDAGTVVSKYLRETVGLSGLDAVIATHEHDDHLFGMPDALRGLTVDTVYSSSAVPMSWWFNKIMPVLGQAGLTVLNPLPGDSFPLGSATVTFLNPLIADAAPNDLSLVVRIDCGEASALLTADIEGAAEIALEKSGASLKADVLKVAHHGGNTSSGEAFLKAVNPSLAVISVGAGNPHGHPHPEPLNNLQRLNIPVYRTDQFGTVVLTYDGFSWSVEFSKAR